MGLNLFPDPCCPMFSPRLCIYGLDSPLYLCRLQPIITQRVGSKLPPGATSRLQSASWFLPKAKRARDSSYFASLLSSHFHPRGSKNTIFAHLSVLSDVIGRKVYFREGRRRRVRCQSRERAKPGLVLICGVSRCCDAPRCSLSILQRIDSGI